MIHSLLYSFILISFFFVSTSLCESERDYAEYWINVYDGAISQGDNSMAKTAYEVFNTVKYAADKSTKRIPKLIILRKGDAPWAMAIKDGTVLITQEAIHACLHGIDPMIGQARLAFIFGHEMAHLAADDYWDDNALETLSHIDHTDNRKQLFSLLTTDNHANEKQKASKPIQTMNFAEHKKREIKADSLGLLYSYIAGYSPKAIFDHDHQIFFANWTSTPDNTHPSPAIRASYLSTEINLLIKKIDLFYLGIRLFQLGKYDDALGFMNALKHMFPSREVFNTIGLIYYQKACHSLVIDDPERIARFKLATILDSESRIKPYEPFRSGQSEFSDSIQKAIENFKVAIEKDPHYLPSMINLSSAFIINMNYNDASAILDKATQLSDNNADVINNQAIAMYLQGQKIHADLFQHAMNKLKIIINTNPDIPDTFYNMGRLFIERNRQASANESFATYLNLKPFGFYSKYASNIIGKKENTYRTNKACYHTIKSLCPIPLGRLNDHIKQQINKLNLDKYELPIHTVIGYYMSGHGYLVLVLEDVVELVEMDVKSNVVLNLSDLKTCPPLNSFVGYPNTNKSYIFQDFAVDVHHNAISKVVFYGKHFFKNNQ